MHIGDLIRLKRKSHRMTQKELSKILYSSTYRICRLEKEPRILKNFTFDEISRLSKILDIDIDLLIEERNKL